MNVPPRNVKTDKLTSYPLLSFAYFQAGVIETCACLFAFFQALSFWGINGEDVAKVNNNYFPSPDGSNYVTRSGEVINSAIQDHILAVAQAQYYLMIVIIQVRLPSALASSKLVLVGR